MPRAERTAHPYNFLADPGRLAYHARNESFRDSESRHGTVGSFL